MGPKGGDVKEMMEKKLGKPKYAWGKKPKALTSDLLRGQKGEAA